MQANTIYIIGAGAIGKALAIFLQRTGKKVFLVRGTVDDGSCYIENIKVELNNGAIVAAKVHITTLSTITRFDGWVVFTNKAFGNSALAKEVKTKIGNAPVVLLQNGLGIEQPFIDNGYLHIYRGVLFATSQLTALNTLQFKPVADSPIGIVKGDRDTMYAIVGQLNNPDFKFIAEENIHPVIWTKAIVNCVFNSVCALLDTDNGIFYREENALRIARRVITEGVVVAQKMGIALQAEEVEASLLRISRASEGQFISTLQDIRNKRPTEIESLNFAIVNVALGLNMQDLIQETRLLGELVNIKSGIS